MESVSSPSVLDKKWRLLMKPLFLWYSPFACGEIGGVCLAVGSRVATALRQTIRLVLRTTGGVGLAAGSQAAVALRPTLEPTRARKAKRAIGCKNAHAVPIATRHTKTKLNRTLPFPPALKYDWYCISNIQSFVVRRNYREYKHK